MAVGGSTFPALPAVAVAVGSVIGNGLLWPVWWPCVGSTLPAVPVLPAVAVAVAVVCCGSAISATVGCGVVAASVIGNSLLCLYGDSVAVLVCVVLLLLVLLYRQQSDVALLPVLVLVAFHCCRVGGSTLPAVAVGVCVWYW